MRKPTAVDSNDANVNEALTDTAQAAEASVVKGGSQDEVLLPSRTGLPNTQHLCGTLVLEVKRGLLMICCIVACQTRR